MSATAASPVSDARARIAVVILNWNGADDTLGCLESLAAQSVDPAELLVIDNGSEDDSVARIRGAFPEVELLESSVNLGFAAGVNLGIARTRSPWVLLLNNDTTLTPDALRHLTEAAAVATSDIGMLQPLLVFRDRPGHVNSSGVVLHPNGSANDRDFGRDLDDDPGFDAEPFAVTAGAGLYRRAMLEAVRLPSGYFDRTFFMYFEDVDLGWRARLAGWRAGVVTASRVVHSFRGSSAKRPGPFVERLCKLNRARMLMKNGSIGMILRFAISPRPRRDFIWLLRQDGPSGFAAAFRALRDGLSERRHVTALLTGPRREIERTWLGRERVGPFTPSLTADG